MSPKTTNNQSKPRARRKNATILPVMLASAALFASMAGFLGVQVANGQDPMLGPAKPVVAQKNLILRKVIQTKKIVTIVDTPAAGATATGNGAVYASSGSSSGPTQTYSAPVQSAPAPVQTATS